MNQDALSSLCGAYDSVPLCRAIPTAARAACLPVPVLGRAVWRKHVPALPDARMLTLPVLLRNCSATLIHWARCVFLLFELLFLLIIIEIPLYQIHWPLHKFWTQVAIEFRHFDNLLGYNLLNELWAGEVYTNPLKFLPGVCFLANMCTEQNIVQNMVLASIQSIQRTTVQRIIHSTYCIRSNCAFFS